MKNVIIAFVLFALSIAAHAEERKFLASLKCTATEFRQNGGEPTQDLNSLMWMNVVNVDGKVQLEEYGGHILVSGYYGVFTGTNLVETPYKRAEVYTNHYRFLDMDASFTA